MAETQDERHITINAHEDEVVIFAGQREAERISVDQGEGACKSSSSVASPDPDQGSSQASKGDPAHVNADGYQATTLDDLKSSKMSTTQKAIIVLAVIGLIAFIVWYVVFSG